MTIEHTISSLSNLRIEIYLIGYNTKGESIVFLIYDNAKPKEILYSGVIDSYEGGEPKSNVTATILNEKDIRKLLIEY